MSREATLQTQQTPTSHPLSQGSILQRKCRACGQHKTGGGTCAKCQAKNGAEPLQKLPTIQTKLTVGQPNDKYEQEADQVAEQIMRMPAARTIGDARTQFRPPTVQRMCATCEEEEKLQTKEMPGSTPEVTPAIASRIQSLQGGGQPLPASTRNFFEPRFGHDFSHVRVHSDESAQALNANAYTTGSTIVFRQGHYQPTSSSGKKLLAHELTHVVQQSGPNMMHVGAKRSLFREEDQTAAVLPTEEQRDQILGIFNPQQSAGSTPEIADPAAFKRELVAVGDTLRAGNTARADAVHNAPVVLSETDLTDVTTIAEQEVRNTVGSALSSGVDLAAVRRRIQYIPRAPGTSPAAGEATLTEAQLSSLDQSAARIKISRSADARRIISNHHALTGGRDRALFNQALRDIVARAPADWRKIALGFRGWNTSTATLVQGRIVPKSGESEEQARRRGRWLNLGTSIHEMLHAVTHPNFTRAIRRLERADLGIEGFTEFFTRRIYAEIISRASSNAAFRRRIEGAAGPAFTPPPRTSYGTFFTTVTSIFNLLNDNIENMRQAYFRGRVEFLGLGPWNTLIHGLPDQRANVIGGAVLLQTEGGSFESTSALRVSYGNLIWGHSGRVQVDLRGGAGLTYLSEGHRLGLGLDASLTVRGAHLFLEGGGLLQGSVAASGPATPNFDVLFRGTAGVRYGRFQLGPSVELLLPVTDRNAADRGKRVFFGLGASFVFGN
ncbi:MAG: DUF4157 domain-containing protein [Cyanobacteria bacterium P01_F01_bin.86]